MEVPLDLIAQYGLCPLKARYIGWTKVDQPRTVLEAADRAIRTGVGAYLWEISKDRATKGRGIRVAVAAYKKAFSEYPREGLLGASFDFTRAFNHGLATINALAQYLLPWRDVAVMGRLEARVVVKEDAVLGDILGLVSYSDPEPTERRYCIVVAGRRSKTPSSWEKLPTGFAAAFLRQELKNTLGKYETGVLFLDLDEATVSLWPTLDGDELAFYSLAECAIVGMKANVFPPQPNRTKCAECPFQSRCQPLYAKPSVSKTAIKSFLSRG